MASGLGFVSAQAAQAMAPVPTRIFAQCEIENTAAL